MLYTLSGRLALLLFCTLVAVVAGYGVLTFRGSQAHLDEANQKLNRDLARYLVEANKLARGDEVNRRALSKLFANLMSVNPNIEIYLLDSDGTILTYSAAEERVRRRTVELGPVREFLAGGSMFPLMGEDPRDLSRLKVFSAAPIPLQGAPEAFLYVVLGGEEYQSIADMLAESRLLRTRLFAVVLAAVLLTAWFLLFWSITRRLRRLSMQVEEFRRGPLGSSPAPALGRGDDIDQLQDAFEQMSARIARQVDDLKNTDQLRRELVANVSHDLRTPLTILHGYLETLLIEGDKLSHAERRNYIETATRHSERLGRLVHELFELAKLESPGVTLQLEPFSLADLVQDTTQEFQQLAAQKGAAIQTTLDDQIRTLRGDIALIERVLENVLQNALNHVPSGGTVAVTVSSGQDQVTVTVSDNGCGIPDEDLPYVFDRFYRSRSADREQSQGAGLGLAISKRIVELHGGSIRAESRLNVGTTLTFNLPLGGPSDGGPTISAATTRSTP